MTAFFTECPPCNDHRPATLTVAQVIATDPRTALTLGHFGIDAETPPSFYSRDFVPYLGSWIRGNG